MRKALLYRICYPTFSAGFMPFNDQMIYTVEKPWVCDDPEEARAGVPFQSCVPAGLYKLDPFTRGNGARVWSLSNPELGVFVKKEHRLYDTDRYACLIHIANRAHEVVGCIGPGLGSLHRSGGYAVTHSREAVAALHMRLADVTHLEIIEL